MIGQTVNTVRNCVYVGKNQTPKKQLSMGGKQ